MFQCWSASHRCVHCAVCHARDGLFDDFSAGVDGGCKQLHRDHVAVVCCAGQPDVAYCATMLEIVHQHYCTPTPLYTHTTVHHHCTTILLYTRTTVQQYYCTPTPLYNNIIVHPHHCTTILLYTHTTVQQYYCTPTPLYNNIYCVAQRTHEQQGLGGQCCCCCR